MAVFELGLYENNWERVLTLSVLVIEEST